MNTPCELLQNQMGLLFRCTDMGRSVRLRTPFMYPDGDYIDLFLEDANGDLTLSDYGETVRWLRMQTASLKRSAKQTQMIQDICLTHGVEFFKGMLQVRVQDLKDLAFAVTRLSQAALRTADIWFTFRNRTVGSSTEEVGDLLREQNIEFDQNVTQIGRSGQRWPINFYTRTQKRSSLVNVLSTGSRGATRRLTEHLVATWYDLSQLKVGPEALHFVSLFDDTSDVWSPEDFKQLEELSDIARLSQPDEFIRYISAA